MTAGELHPVVLLASASWDRLTLWGFEVHVSVLIGTVYLAAIYLFAIGPAREKYRWWPDPTSRWRRVSSATRRAAPRNFGLAVKSYASIRLMNFQAGLRQ